MVLMPVVLSGGAGSRLWPLSRQDRPKPFVTMPGGATPAVATYARAARLDGVTRIVTVTGRDLLFLSADAIAAADAPPCDHTLLLEPEGRGTAAAVALAARHAADRHGGDAVLLVLPADHLIADEGAFAAAVARAAGLARQERIAVFGVAPDRAETGFGYIEIEDGNGGERVLAFVEKPDAMAAAAFVAGGRHRWNSGMFCFAAQTMLAAMEAHCPDVLDAASRALRQGRPGLAGGFETVEVAAGPYRAAPALSLDHAVMEKVAPSPLSCVPLACGWADIGSWPAASALVAPDAAGNRATGDVVLDAASGCFVMAGQRLVALVGVSDLVVVDTPDALLVADAGSACQAGRIYGDLRERGHPAARADGGRGKPPLS